MHDDQHVLTKSTPIASSVRATPAAAGAAKAKRHSASEAGASRFCHGVRAVPRGHRVCA